MKAWLASIGFLWALSHATARADLDVAFVLDTTGSMSGELREVKERVRQISTALVASRPGERVRLAVVAFRDRGDEYVTRHSALTPHVDDTLAFLSALTADGGGDGPEDVLSGLRTALDELDWGPRPATAREVFLIGDAPAHLDYEDHVTARDVIAAARAAQLVIHSVGCRSLPPGGVELFRELSFATEGSYQHIGRVTLGEASDEGLAEAVLQALSAKRASTSRPLPLAWSRAAEAGEVATLGASLRPQASGGCELDVRAPRGTKLAAEPSVHVSEDGALRVGLRLDAGVAERWHAYVDDCVATATVDVRVEAN